MPIRVAVHTLVTCPNQVLRVEHVASAGLATATLIYRPLEPSIPYFPTRNLRLALRGKDCHTQRDFARHTTPLEHNHGIPTGYHAEAANLKSGSG